MADASREAGYGDVMDDAAALARLIDAMRPWLEKVVFVGGWAHRLHRFHPDATVPTYQPIVTRDVDVAFDTPRGMTGNIGDALKSAGFNETLSGEHPPPVSHHTLGGENKGFHVEFLAPLKGSGTRRDGSQDATTVAAGITAQKLRHLDLLLVAPWRLELKAVEDIPVSDTVAVLVANPVSYMAQKLLIHTERRGIKKAQDILYLNDTLELFGGRMEALRNCWLNEVRPALTGRQIAAVKSALVDGFSVITDTTRDAARIAQGRRLTAGEIQLRCSVGLGELFQG